MKKLYKNGKLIFEERNSERLPPTRDIGFKYHLQIRTNLSCIPLDKLHRSDIFCTQHVLRVLCWILNIFQHFCSNFDPLLTISVQKIRLKNSPIFLTDFSLLSMWPSSWFDRNLILCKLFLFLFFLWKKFFSFARIYLRKIHQI